MLSVVREGFRARRLLFNARRRDRKATYDNAHYRTCRAKRLPARRSRPKVPEPPERRPEFILLPFSRAGPLVSMIPSLYQQNEGVALLSHRALCSLLSQV